MKLRLFSASIVAVAMASLAWADTDIVNETFDSYIDQDAFEEVWEQQDNLGFGRSSGFLVPNTQIGLTPPNDDPPGIDGKGVNIGDPANSGIWSEYSPGAFSLTPTESQSVRVSGDFFDDAVGNKRTTIGLRRNEVVPIEDPAANLVELGYWNANTFDPIDPKNAPPNDPVEDVPSVGYSYRLQLFESWGGDLVRNPNWQPFVLDPVLDTNGVGGIPDGLVTPLDIGQGWHRYTATISPTEVTLTLDLYRDELANSEAIEGVGSPGVDATVTWEMGLVDVPFDSLRIGGPSGVTSAHESVVDNILLEMIDVAAGENADFEPDGDVDGNDLLIWQRGNGIDDGTALPVNGDANLDGNVNAVDLGIWGDQYGNSAAVSAVSPVPEPASIGLVLLTMAGLAMGRRSWR